MYGRESSGFSSCSNLEEIKLPDAMTNVGDRTFEFCTSLRVLEFPVGVTAIGRGAIRGMTNKIICRPVMPPTLGTTNNSGTATIYVPDESVDAYKAATNWSTAQIANRIRPLSEFTE